MFLCGIWYFKLFVQALDFSGFGASWAQLWVYMKYSLVLLTDGSDNVMAVFHDEIEIEDFEYDEDTETYTYPCPCGDQFEITKVCLFDRFS